jgi:hypothetical protein
MFVPAARFTVVDQVPFHVKAVDAKGFPVEGGRHRFSVFGAASHRRKGDPLTLLQFPDQRGLFGGQYAGMYLFNASGASEMARRLLIVTCDQRGADTERMQAAHGLGGVRPQRVPKRHETKQHAVARDADHGEPARFGLIDTSLMGREVHGFCREKRWASDREFITLQAGPNAPTRDSLESFDLRQRDTTSKRLFDDCARERVLG